MKFFLKDVLKKWTDRAVDYLDRKENGKWEVVCEIYANKYINTTDQTFDEAMKMILLNLQMKSQLQKLEDVPRYHMKTCPNCGAIGYRAIKTAAEATALKKSEDKQKPHCQAKLTD